MFHWVYENAWLFVDLFFLLSGIVLTYRYLEPLASRALTGRKFLNLRISRLYPLHVATLLVCAAVEWTCMARHEPTIIYQGNNDLYHFTLQLTYLHTFFEHGWSFNEPSWSVSGEVLVYILFFAYARRGHASYVPLAVAMVVVGIATQSPGWNLPIINSQIGRALVGFFLGSLGFLAMREFDRRGQGAKFGWACLGALTVVCVLASLIGFHELIGTNAFPNALMVFPLVAFASLRAPPLARLLSLRPLTFLGDLSYAIYLIHVPAADDLPGRHPRRAPAGSHGEPVAAGQLCRRAGPRRLRRRTMDSKCRCGAGYVAARERAEESARARVAAA